MKHHHIRLVYIFFTLVLMSSCSAAYLGPQFREFSDATTLLGKNVDYVIQQSREEELNLRREESLLKDTVTADDFQATVLTIERVGIRKELTEYLTAYAKLLASLAEPGDGDDLQQRAVRVYTNICAVNVSHQNFLSENEQGVIASCAAAIPQAMTTSKRRGMLLRIMDENQPRLEKITSLVAEELGDLRIMLNNFYDRQFHLSIKQQWRDHKKSRQQLARAAQEMTVRRESINVIFSDLIKALAYIPRTHKTLRDTLRHHGSAFKSTAELLDFAYRVEAYFQEFSQ